MNTKKVASIATFIFALTYANFASAVEWTPLVRIPGLPANGAVNLSMYMIGLYNFLLSIVGIVAVMMLIIGGMRYITAAGNAAAISDAKDIIQNAVIGLIIALFSWIFIATINPDALYIRQPGSSFVASTVHGVCYQSFDSVSPPPGACICIDGTTIALQPDAETCDAQCKIGNCNLPGFLSCIAPGSPLEFTSLDFLNRSTYDGKCKCVNGAYVTPVIDGAPDPANCEEVCDNPAFAIPGVNHCYVADFRMGRPNVADAFSLPTDKDRAKKYAIYDGRVWEEGVEVIEECTVYVNAADYTSKFSDLTHLVVDKGALGLFDGDCWVKPGMDLLAQPDPGYYGWPHPVDFLGCGVDDIGLWWPGWVAEVAAGRCKMGDGGDSITCPIRICAEWVDGTRVEHIKYLKLLKP